MDKKELELYIHIPFCVKKCSYCDFLSAPATEQTREAYMAALFAEIGGRAKNYKDRIVTSIFIGGGTPSLLSGEQGGKLMDHIRKQFVLAPDAEITMEVNPGTATAQKLRDFHAVGINRLSIGMQSAQAQELRMLGRIHDFEDFCQGYREAVEAGFTNINVDVMSGLPGQTLAGYRDTLEKVLHLEPMPQHISAYSLIVEEGTPFAVMAERGQLPLPEEDVERAMYEETIEVLEKYGFHRYEISNYARDGYECRHNVGYWIRRDYLGFGIGAASLIDNVRFQNGRDLAAYLAHPLDCREEEQSLTTQEQMEETLFLGLRLTKGVSYDAFARQYGSSLQEIYGEVIARNVADGLLQVTEGKENEKSGRYLALTKRGLDLSNYVMAQFLF
mgnify:FL=1